MRMTKSLSLAGMAGALTFAAFTAAQAADPVKIGFITTLSGPTGYLGEDIRDGFRLAIEQEGGKLGGIPVELVIEDDGMKPGSAKQIADRMLKRDKIKIFTGLVFTHVLHAAVPDMLQAGAFYVGPNAAPQEYAGKSCHKNYFAAAWENENLHEAAGEAANKAGYKNVYLIAANYQTGRDAVTGFKRLYKGNVAGEAYTKLDQTDYAAELATIRQAKPDAVFQFLPGGLGINFYKQFDQAGLGKEIGHIANGSSADPRIVEALGKAAIGIKYSAFWEPDFANAANKKMVADYRAKHKREPTMYVAQGYDTARLIGSALKAVNGDMKKSDQFREALRQAKFDSVRGKFVFGSNHNPIQDWYMYEIVAGADGKPERKNRGLLLENHRDVHMVQCRMNG